MTDFKKKHGLFLTGIHQKRGFQDWLEDIEDQSPAIPTFDPQQTQDKDAWVYYSGMREGYKLALSYLGVILDD